MNPHKTLSPRVKEPYFKQQLKNNKNKEKAPDEGAFFVFVPFFCLKSADFSLRIQIAFLAGF